MTLYFTSECAHLQAEKAGLAISRLLCRPFSITTPVKDQFARSKMMLAFSSEKWTVRYPQIGAPFKDLYEKAGRVHLFTGKPHLYRYLQCHVRTPLWKYGTTATLHLDVLRWYMHIQ